MNGEKRNWLTVGGRIESREVCFSLGQTTYVCRLMDIHLIGKRKENKKKWANAGMMSLNRPKEMSCSR